MIRRPTRYKRKESSAASDVYKRQLHVQTTAQAISIFMLLQMVNSNRSSTITTFSYYTIARFTYLILPKVALFSYLDKNLFLFKWEKSRKLSIGQPFISPLHQYISQEIIAQHCCIIEKIDKTQVLLLGVQQACL